MKPYCAARAATGLSGGRNLPKPPKTPSPIIGRLYLFWLLPLGHAQLKKIRYFQRAE
jgi:hypothetical protein